MVKSEGILKRDENITKKGMTYTENPTVPKSNQDETIKYAEKINILLFYVALVKDDISSLFTKKN